MARKSNKRRSKKRVAKRRGGKRRGVKRRGAKRNSAFANAMRKLSRLRPPQRVEAMKLANNNFVRQFCHNVKSLRRARLSPSVRKRLRNNSKSLRKLVSSKTNVNSKRKMLTQRGGFLGLLLPLIIKAATGGFNR